LFALCTIDVQSSGRFSVLLLLPKEEEDLADPHGTARTRIGRIGGQASEGRWTARRSWSRTRKYIVRSKPLHNLFETNRVILIIMFRYEKGVAPKVQRHQAAKGLTFAVQRSLRISYFLKCHDAFSHATSQPDSAGPIVLDRFTQ